MASGEYAPVVGIENWNGDAKPAGEVSSPCAEIVDAAPTDRVRRAISSSICHHTLVTDDDIVIAADETRVFVVANAGGVAVVRYTANVNVGPPALVLSNPPVFSFADVDSSPVFLNCDPYSLHAG